jgi:hypothetical protein
LKRKIQIGKIAALLLFVSSSISSMVIYAQGEPPPPPATGAPIDGFFGIFIMIAAALGGRKWLLGRSIDKSQ